MKHINLGLFSWNETRWLLGRFSGQHFKELQTTPSRRFNASRERCSRVLTQSGIFGLTAF